MLSFLELLGLASIGVLIVQLLSNQEIIDFYIVDFSSRISASIFILAIWIVRVVLVVFLNGLNHAFIQQIKSGIQVAQCNIAFASKSRSDQIETGRLFTALTNEVQMLTGQVFIPLSMALAEAILVILFVAVSLFVLPAGALLAGGIVASGYLVTHKIISPVTNRLGKNRLEAERGWSEKIVNAFSLRREAEVYGVIARVKEELLRQISASNKISGRFYAIAPLNRGSLETVGILAILGLLLVADSVQATNEQIMFIILTLVRMLPSATRILAAVQSYRFASPVITKQLSYLQQGPLHQNFLGSNRILVTDSRLTYHFREGIEPRKIDLSLDGKELVVITGESGLGKTTMLDELVDFFVAERIRGINYVTEISYASQNNLVIEKGIHENLAFYREMSDTKLSGGVKLLQGWGITAEHFDSERRVTDFSSGQKKRVAVARALNCENAVIILDEPTAGLDQTIADSVISSIRHKAHDNLIIVATHDRGLIAAANTVFELKKGTKP